MQAASLFIVPNRIVCPLHLHGASDQALMEAFIDGLTEKSKHIFKNPDGSYKEVCKWKGVQCDGRRRATDINWGEITRVAQSFAGTMDFDLLPPSITCLALFHASHTMRAALDTSALPPSMSGLILRGAGIRAPIDLRRLPKFLQIFAVTSSMLTGSCSLTALPCRLTNLSLRENWLDGSIMLDHLPSTLESLDLSKNSLSGSLRLYHLPSRLALLNLNENKFYGEINFAHLLQNESLKEIHIRSNQVMGSLKIPSLPKSVDILDVTDNAFFGTAVISRATFPAVSASFAKMANVVDENGAPYTSSELRKNRRMKRPQQLSYRSEIDNLSAYSAEPKRQFNDYGR